jgi:hypothetical protein
VPLPLWQTLWPTSPAALAGAEQRLGERIVVADSRAAIGRGDVQFFDGCFIVAPFTGLPLLASRTSGCAKAALGKHSTPDQDGCQFRALMLSPQRLGPADLLAPCATDELAVPRTRRQAGRREGTPLRSRSATKAAGLCLNNGKGPVASPPGMVPPGPYSYTGGLSAPFR